MLRLFIILCSLLAVPWGAWAFELIGSGVVAGASGAAYTDDFNRAPESPITTPWTVSTGFDAAVKIVSNAVVGSEAGIETVAVYTSGTFGDNQYSEIEVPSSFNSLLGVVVRSDISKRQGYVFIRMSTDSAQIGGWNNGSWIGVLASCPSIDFSGGKIMRIEASGTSIVGKINGTAVCSATDNSIPTGKPGIYTKDNINSMDNWAGGDL